MTDSSTSHQVASRAERLLAMLAGVLSVHVRVSELGRVEEIHILAADAIHPKQVVRNVESALRAGLGLEVDRRVVSVAQVARSANGNGAAVEAVPVTADDVTAAAATADAPGGRLVLAGFDARCDGQRLATCTVRLRRGTELYEGLGRGAGTAQGRAEAAARALFAAVARARGAEDLGLEAAVVAETHGRSYVLIAARALAGRESLPLAGAALLSRSPEEAAILASLQATNRWADLPGEPREVA